MDFTPNKAVAYLWILIDEVGDFQNEALKHVVKTITPSDDRSLAVVSAVWSLLTAVALIQHKQLDGAEFDGVTLTR